MKFPNPFNKSQQPSAAEKPVVPELSRVEQEERALFEQERTRANPEDLAVVDRAMRNLEKGLLSALSFRRLQYREYGKKIDDKDKYDSREEQAVRVFFGCR